MRHWVITLASCLSIFANISYAQQSRWQTIPDYQLTPSESGKMMLQFSSKSFDAFWQAPIKDTKKKEKNFDYFLSFGGWSKHDTHGVPNIFNEVNPIFGGGIWLDYDFLGGRPFIEYGHIVKNSRKGPTDFIMLGNQWTLTQGKHLDLCAGVGINYMRYVDKLHTNRHRVLKGGLPLVYVCLKHEDFTFRVVPLGKDVTFFYATWSF